MGRPHKIQEQIDKLGLRLEDGKNFHIVNPDDHPYYEDAWKKYLELNNRKGVTPAIAKAIVRKHNTLLGTLLLDLGVVDAMICGISSRWDNQLAYVRDIIGLRDGCKHFATMNVIIMPNDTLFLADTQVNVDPDAETVAEITLMASEEMRRFGIVPKVALLATSNFGSRTNKNARKMAEALEIVRTKNPDLEIDGEMHADAALSQRIRLEACPESTLKGSANLLIMPNLESGNISYNLLKMTSGNGITMGPILLGARKPVHIMTTSSTTRRIVNLSALAVIDAQKAS